MDRRFLLVFMFALFLALPWSSEALADPDERGFPGKWWRMSEFAGEITLSQAEKDKLNALYLESRARMIDARAAKSKAKLILDDLLEKEQLDEEAIYAQLELANKALAAMNSERFKFLIEVRKLLGADRHAKLKSLFGKHRMRFRKERMNTQSPSSSGDRPE